ncbi:tRNA (guanine(37)-N(1))-methyltransferase [Bifidobacterium imperatoris]|uniref:tRNA (guanine-N(1)-)-methyltransferase n=1 Tax=Bifidobacterium imperatoris TaxID=2020965 RepID=A0A2N5ISX8_9BIFI|nr:tRNA (guanine(37)-N(1))-methyltransferase [Bifidobacterium imperatoris]PLS25062.1 tRNA (guanine-N1)-methyltransferase [Bifidobacterium imperatoris]QSY58691.1 tRNA (guanine(37)-N(1))-methyltransferase [Bifidobacterium imperatoris]
MKIDIVSVFPEYFEVLNLSLMGKAQSKGLLEITAHNLRDWTHDVHHSVDDTPVGGGAGMVMKPEVWAECLDELLGLPTPNEDDSPDELVFPTSEFADSPVEEALDFSEIHDDATFDDDIEDAENAGEIADIVDGSENKPGDAEATSLPADESETSHVAPVLIFPNPSAPLFTQRDATELSHAEHLLFGCGRYEGYDSRIPDYYRAQGVDVREYSIGDYVLNGGEVAVSVMLEAITRLMPGFMGNPDSIVEESYTGEGALLEHRQYTKPAVWRGLKVPDVLLSGDHGNVDRFRRDEALTRTNEIRPDLIEALDCKALDKADRKTLMALGWEVSAAHPRRLN